MNTLKTATYLLKDDVVVYSANLDKVVIDERVLPSSIKKVIIKSNKPIDLMIVYAQSFSQLIYQIDAHVNGQISQLYVDDDLKISRKIELLENTNIVFATADFSPFNRHIKIDVHLCGEYATSDWNLSTFADKKKQKVFDVSFLHDAANTVANMKHYGVIIDSSSLVFSGTNFIGGDIRNCESHQTAKIIIFDDKAYAKADPILIIHNNDVIAASHAATMGKVNAEHLFYLQSRGISEQDTKKIITKGYLQPIIKYFADQEVAEHLQNQLEEAI